MTQEEIEWYEDNWHRGKSLKEKTTDSREYKSVHVPRWYDWEDGPNYYWKDNHCWKTKRKTHYKIPKVKKEKKRKPKEKEHWRGKKNQTWLYRHHLNRKLREERCASRKREQDRQRAHIEELQRTGKWVYNWRDDGYYDSYSRTYRYRKLDLNNPFDYKDFKTSRRIFSPEKNLTFSRYAVC